MVCDTRLLVASVAVGNGRFSSVSVLSLSPSSCPLSLLVDAIELSRFSQEYTKGC